MIHKSFEKLEKPGIVFASLILFAITGLFSVSCSSDKSFDEESKYLIKSSMSADDYNEFILKVNQSIGTKSTFTAQDELTCKEICTPLVNDGLMIQQDLLKQAQQQHAQEDFEFFQDLTDEQLATLSFVVYEIYTAAPNVETTTEIDGGQILTCLEAALGISGIKSLWSDIVFDGAVIGLTAKATLKAIGKHYLGWLGIALTVYDFYDCISGWQE